MKIVIKAIETRKAIDSQYQFENLNRDNLETDLEIENDNYESISASTNENKEIVVDAIGQNEWDGLEVHGSRNDLVVSNSDGSPSGDNSEGMIYVARETTYEYETATTKITFDYTDDGQAAIAPGFNIKFGNKIYSTLYVTTNGYLSFDTSNLYESEYLNFIYGVLDYTIIAPYWSDLTYDEAQVPGSGIYYKTGVESGKDYILVEYRDVINYNSSYGAGYTGNFEVKIYEDGIIKISYKDASFGSPSITNGLDALAGVYVSGTNYAQYTYETANLVGTKTITYKMEPGKIDPIYPTLADDTCYTFNSTTRSITGYNYASDLCPFKLEISETIGGVPVEHIGSNAFQNSDLVEVILPSNLITIDANAFKSSLLVNVDTSKATKLTMIDDYSFASTLLDYIDLSKSILLTTIDNNAFSNSELENAILPNSITKIGDYAFYWNFLDTINLPTNLTTLGKAAFTNNHLTEIVIPENVTLILEYTFQNNNLTSITFGNKITQIGERAFFGNDLTNVILPNSVTTIGINAFSENQLTSLNIPNSVVTIDSNAFSKNKITSLAIGTGVKSINADAFRDNLLSNINIPTNVTTIGTFAFAKNKIESATIPTSVTSLGSGVLNDNLFSDSSAFIYARNTDGTENNTKLLSYGGMKKDNVSIPSNIITIGVSSFSDAKINSVIIPTSVTTIENYAFQYNLLASVTIPNSVTTIGTMAFASNQLTNIIIPNSVTTLGTWAFNFNHLTSVTLSTSMTIVDDYTFYSNAITNVTIPSNILTIDYNAFASNAISSVTFENGVKTIGQNSFRNNQLSSILIPNSVTTISSGAFSFNTPLSSVTIDNVSGAVTVSASAFYNGVVPTYLR